MDMRGRRSHPVSYNLVVSLGFQERRVEAGLVLLVIAAPIPRRKR